MEEERVTGVIFAPTRRTVERMTEIPRNFPTVLIDRACQHSQEDAVVLDNHAAAGMLVEHLHAQGYRRMIGLFGNASTTGIERHGGYEAAMTRFGLTPEAVFIPPTAEAAEAEVRRRIADGADLESRPDAVIASNGLLLMGVVRAAGAAGLAIPENLAVAGFDNERWTELVGPGITVIEQPIEAIGRTAMAMLLERLETPDAPIRKVVLSGRCVIRGSTAPRASPKPR